MFFHFYANQPGPLMLVTWFGQRSQLINCGPTHLFNETNSCTVKEYSKVVYAIVLGMVNRQDTRLQPVV